MAKATDNRGATTSSSVVTISVVNNTPVAVTLLNPAVSGSDFSFSFATQTGLGYTVQFTDSLNPIGWNVLTNFTGNGSTATVTHTDIAAQRMYRVASQ